MQIISFLFMFALTKAGSAFAAAGELPIEAATSTNPGNDFVPEVVVWLLALLCLALFVNGTRQRTWGRLSRSSAENLFLNMRFSELDAASPCADRAAVRMGHLLDISLKDATFVSPVPCSKGARLQLSLDSLPDFPTSGSVAPAEVTGCQSLGGDPTTFLVSVRFVDLSPNERYPLMRYLKYLTQPSRIRHV